MQVKPRRRLRGQSFNRLIPNILTLMALCAGVTAMRFGLEGLWERAVIAILVAGVLDGLDGRIARILGATAASARSSTRSPTSSPSGSRRPSWSICGACRGPAASAGP